jgi:hypothetical protein
MSCPLVGPPTVDTRIRAERRSRSLLERVTAGGVTVSPPQRAAGTEIEHRRYSARAVAALSHGRLTRAVNRSGDSRVPTGRSDHQENTVTVPAEVLHLQNWKLTLPVKPEHVTPTMTRNGSAYEVSQHELAKYEEASCFFVTDDGKGVVMRVHHGDLVTHGSHNPRCELREMTSDGMDTHDWSGKSGTHTLVVEGQVNRLTAKTRTVVLAQVHNDPPKGSGKKSKDLTVFRLEGTTLYVTNDNDDQWHTVTTDFALKTRYTLKIEVKDGNTSYWYNGKRMDFTLPNHDSTNFFKAGNYLQSNEKSAKGESTKEYAEVVLYSVTVTHGP